LTGIFRFFYAKKTKQKKKRKIPVIASCPHASKRKRNRKERPAKMGEAKRKRGADMPEMTFVFLPVATSSS